MTLVNDGKNLDFLAVHIVEDTNVSDAQPILWLFHITEALNPTSAQTCRLVREVQIDGISYRCTTVRRQQSEIIQRLLRENDMVSHSGQMMALLWPHVKLKCFTLNRPTSPSQKPGLRR